MADLNSTILEQLAEFNQEFLRYRIPALVFLGLMSLLGILGNASVIYIYGFHLKYSNLHLFITVLAVSDIISCFISIPMEMYSLSVFYDYASIAACKFAGFFMFACYICSVLMLLLISVERYVKVCRSTGTQVSKKMAKILSGAIFFISTLLAVPVPVFAGTHVYTLDNGRLVQNCSYYIEMELYYYCVGFFVFLLCVLGAMSAFYWRVIKTTRSHVEWSQQRKVKVNADVINNELQMQKSAAETKILQQTNRTVIWISAVYAASCVPSFLIAAVSKFFTHRKPESPVNFLIFFIIQSWSLNCTLNPIVYGFLNSKFRTEFFTLLHLNLGRTNLSSAESLEESNKTCSTATS